MNKEDLIKDKNEIQENILKIQDAINIKQNEVQQLQNQLVRFSGALGYISDNLNKEDTPCSEEV